MEEDQNGRRPKPVVWAEEGIIFNHSNHPPPTTTTLPIANVLANQKKIWICCQDPDFYPQPLPGPNPNPNQTPAPTLTQLIVKLECGSANPACNKLDLYNFDYNILFQFKQTWL